MKFLIIAFLFFALSTRSYGQVKAPTNAETPTITTPTTEVKKPTRDSRFLLNVSIGSFQDTVITTLNSLSIESKANYLSQSLWVDYERFSSKAGYGLSTRIHIGQVDIEKVQGVNYPRTAWSGLELVPRYIYRFNAKSEGLINIHLIQKTLQGIGTSYSAGASLEYRIRILPSLFLTQSVGTYGAGNAPLIFAGFSYLLY